MKTTEQMNNELQEKFPFLEIISENIMENNIIDLQKNLEENYNMINKLNVIMIYENIVMKIIFTCQKLNMTEKKMKLQMILKNF